MSLTLIPTKTEAFGAWPMYAPTTVSEFGASEELSAHAESIYTVILASGTEDGGKRATLALSMACTALSMDLTTHLFLVGAGSIWAYQGHADGIQVDGFPALDELLESFVDLGGNLAVCSTCNQALCHATGSQERAFTRRPGVQIQGMATVMEHLMQGRAVTF